MSGSPSASMSSEGRREGVLLRELHETALDGAERQEAAHVLVAPPAVVAPQVVRRLPAPGVVPVGEEQVAVAVAVAVVVGRGHRMGVPADPQTEALRGLPEVARAVIAIELHLARLDRHEILPAVVVEIDEVPRPIHFGGPDPAIVRERREPPPVESEQSAGAALPVGDVELEPSVIVDIAERKTAVLVTHAAQRRRVVVAGVIVQTDGPGHVDEALRGRLRRAGRRIGPRRGGAGAAHAGRTPQHHRQHYGQALHERSRQEGRVDITVAAPSRDSPVMPGWPSPGTRTSIRHKPPALRSVEDVRIPERSRSRHAGSNPVLRREETKIARVDRRR